MEWWVGHETGKGSLTYLWRSGLRSLLARRYSTQSPLHTRLMSQLLNHGLTSAWPRFSKNSSISNDLSMSFYLLQSSSYVSLPRKLTLMSPHNNTHTHTHTHTHTKRSHGLKKWFSGKQQLLPRLVILVQSLSPTWRKEKRSLTPASSSLTSIPTLDK